MKTLVTVFLLLHSLLLLAQAPQQFAFQGVARNGQGQPVANQTVSVRLSIHQGSTSGSTVYGETHSPQTATTGVFTVSVGGGSVQAGSFSAINWSAGPYFLQVELDVAGGNKYAQVSTSQLLSTPYALVANNLNGVNNPQNGDLLEYQNGAWSSKPKTKRYHVSGLGTNPSSALNFLGVRATVLIEKDNPTITINITKVFGSNDGSGGQELFLNLGYRKAGGPVMEFEVNRVKVYSVPTGTSVPMTSTGTYQTNFKAGETYEIGMVGLSSNPGGWSLNENTKGYVEVSY